MTPERRAKAREKLQLIADDARDDAMALDGQPVNGLILGTTLGGLFAMVNRIALIMAEMLDDDEEAHRVQQPPAS